MRRMIKRSNAIFLCIALWSASAGSTELSSTLFCQSFPQASECKETGKVGCETCHGGLPAVNPFGEDIYKSLGGAALETSMSTAWEAVKNKDSDGDNTSNIEELIAGTKPGDKNSVPAEPAKLTWDPETTFRRVKVLYCGNSATYQEMLSLNKAPDKKSFIHSELSKCLGSDYWTKEALHRLADNKIKPLSTIGFGGNVVIGDYRYDYWLFSYVLSGDRDARELLTADYHIDANGNKLTGNVAREEGPEFGERIVIAGGEPLATNRRSGMITTQWFLANFTMFAAVPRNTAAQAYRAYLGVDIAKGEGLIPVEGEPTDPDGANVRQRDCAVCHSTLDPLAYSFANYVGIETVRAFLFNTNGTYNGGRSNLEANGVILGKPVNDLQAWANVAKESDLFKKNLANMFFHHALSRSHRSSEKLEFDALWESLPQDNYSANKLIHRLVDTNAFGGI